MNQKLKITLAAAGLLAVGATIEGARAQLSDDVAQICAAKVSAAHSSYSEYMRDVRDLGNPIVQDQVRMLNRIRREVMRAGDANVLAHHHALMATNSRSTTVGTAAQIAEARRFNQQLALLRSRISGQVNEINDRLSDELVGMRAHRRGCHGLDISNQMQEVRFGSADYSRENDIRLFGSDGVHCNSDGLRGHQVATPSQYMSFDLRLNDESSNPRVTICTYASNFKGATLWNGFSGESTASVRLCSSVDLNNTAAAINGSDLASAESHPEAIAQLQRDYGVDRTWYHLTEDEFVAATVANDDEAEVLGCSATLPTASDSSAVDSTLSTLGACTDNEDGSRTCPSSIGPVTVCPAGRACSTPSAPLPVNNGPAPEVTPVAEGAAE